MRYEYRVTSDAPRLAPRIEREPDKFPMVAIMAMYAHNHMRDGASWAEVQFVRVDDDGTFEVLRRLRLD